MKRIVFICTLLILLTHSVFASDWQDKVAPSILSEIALGEAEFILMLDQQADTDTSHLQTKEAKGTYVYNLLTATAADTQAPLLAILDVAQVEYHSYWITNMIWVKGDFALLQTLAQHPAVAEVVPNGRGTLALPEVDESAGSTTRATHEPNISLVRATDAWALGYRGQGVTIAGIDTGYEWAHPAIKHTYRGWDGESADHDYNWHSAVTIYAPECPDEPCDDHSHGTHTMGTMVGYDAENEHYYGMAPDAQWIGCRALGGTAGLGFYTTYNGCLQWMLAPTKIDGTEPDPTKAPAAINNSWGCLEGCTPEQLRPAVTNLRNAGVVVVASAGNDGDVQCHSIANPISTYPESFTVGSTTLNDEISGFSSRGTVLTINPLAPHMKPDIVAPGSGIRSAVLNGAYGNKSGTSMAGPHVAGLVALIVSANPDLAGDVDMIEQIIRDTAVPLTTEDEILQCGDDTETSVPNNVYGYGRIDALAAVEQAASMRTPTNVTLQQQQGETMSALSNGTLVLILVLTAFSVVSAVFVTRVIRKN